MQDLFRELFKKQGYRVLVTTDPERLFQRIYDDVKAFDVIMLSSGQLGREAVFDAFNKLGGDMRTKLIPTVLLLGEGHGVLTGEAQTTSSRIVVKMPLKGSELRAAILKALAGK